jgi:hypothetical protein
VLISAALALVPASTCLLKLTSGVPCPACGFTRAALALVRGRVRESIALHPMALPSVVLAVIAIALALALPESHRAWGAFTRRAMTLAAVAFVATWALRLAGVLPAV